MDYKIKGTKVLDDILVLKRVAEMESERYQKVGDYSVTDLINPPRVVHLNKRHKHKVQANLANMVNSAYGTAVHEYFEKYLDLWCDKYNYDGYELEEQLTVDWESIKDGEIANRVISGRYDIKEWLHLYDLKNIKVWKLAFDPNFIEFHEQQNFYNLLLRQQGIKLDTINIVALYKDWTEGAALRDKNYPQQQMIEYELTKWPMAETKNLFDQRVQRLVDCEDLPDDDLPICSREERWERHQGGETVHFAILKNRVAKRATKVVKGGTLDDALVIANGMKGMSRDSVIEIRYAFPKRCANYCDINPYCNWYQNWLKKNNNGEVNEYINFKI